MKKVLLLDDNFLYCCNMWPLKRKNINCVIEKYSVIQVTSLGFNYSWNKSVPKHFMYLDTIYTIQTNGNKIWKLLLQKVEILLLLPSFSSHVFPQFYCMLPILSYTHQSRPVEFVPCNSYCPVFSPITCSFNSNFFIRPFNLFIILYTTFKSTLLSFPIYYSLQFLWWLTLLFSSILILVVPRSVAPTYTVIGLIIVSLPSFLYLLTNFPR